MALGFWFRVWAFGFVRSFLASIEGFKSFSLGSGACEIEEMRAAGAFFVQGLA